MLGLLSPSAICNLCTFLSADIFLELTVPGVDGFGKLQNEPGVAELQPWPRCHGLLGRKLLEADDSVASPAKFQNPQSVRPGCVQRTSWGIADQNLPPQNVSPACGLFRAERTQGPKDSDTLTFPTTA